MGSAIPNYGLKDEYGKPILSRNPRFNHLWYSSKVLHMHDNISFTDTLRGVPGGGITQGPTIAQIEKRYSKPS